VADTNERDEGTDTISLPPEAVFTVLRNDRRRAAITTLVSEGEVRSVRALARAVAANEHGIPAAHVTERQYKCVYVSLLQIHLPTLAEKGLVEWENSEGPIRETGSMGALAETIEFLEGICENDRGVEREAIGDAGEGSAP
jgi:1-aminocyclopropane-1-carboxylate deaminase/D-cysteine desulfhydrase-like pyridoxal-dependent ACC family enzyme